MWAKYVEHIWKKNKKISWELVLTYFETYFSITNLPEWLRASTKGTYNSFGGKKKCVRCKHRPNNRSCVCPRYASS
jgi:hypothetical protein